MDCDDFRAALELCLTSPERHFNVYTVLATARELGQQRRTIPTR